MTYDSVNGRSKPVFAPPHCTMSDTGSLTTRTIERGGNDMAQVHGISLHAA